MNYLRELNAFFDWIDSNPCSTGVVALWYTLMAINNRAGWGEDFTVSNLTLQAKTGLSRPQLDRCRNFLIQRGRIRYEKSGRANQAGRYVIVPFVKYETQQETPHDARNDQSQRHETDTGRDTDRSHYLNKTTQNQPIINVNARELHREFERAFGRPPNPVQLQDLCEWVDKGMDRDLAVLAIRQARLKDATLTYAIKILQNQFDQGIRTVADWQAHEAKRQAAAGKQVAGGAQPSSVRDERYENFYKLFPDS